MKKLFGGSPDRGSRGVSNGVDRRFVLRRMAGAAALGAVANRAFAEDATLDQLMQDDGRSGGPLGQDFDQNSRTVHMPKATAPTLSPATEQFTQKAVATYDDIVARGGWPTVPFSSATLPIFRTRSAGLSPSRICSVTTAAGESRPNGFSSFAG